MKVTCVMRRQRCVVAAALAAFTVTCAGCGPSTTTVVGTASPKQPIGQILAVWVDYHLSHKKYPTVSDLKTHLKAMKPDQLARLELTDEDSVSSSPRDHQPYV